MNSFTGQTFYNVTICAILINRHTKADIQFAGMTLLEDFFSISLIVLNQLMLARCFCAMDINHLYDFRRWKLLKSLHKKYDSWLNFILMHDTYL